MTVTFDRNAPNPPVKLGRLDVLSPVRSCPSDRFFCSLGRKTRAACSLSALRCLPNGRVNVDCCAISGGISGVAGTEDDEASAGSFNCLNLLKYRSEANSVMCRGSMVFCTWPLCHSVAD